MGKVYLISDNDITSPNISKQIRNACNNRKSIFICGNQSIKELRLTDNHLLPLFHEKGKEKNVFSHIEFVGHIRAEVHKKRHYLSPADCRYILLKVIERTFHDNIVMLRVFKDIRHSLYELFDFLSFSDTEISEVVVDRIREDYGYIEHSVFLLYNNYRDAVVEIIQAVKNGEKSSFVIESETQGKDENFDTYYNKMKIEIRSLASQYQTIFLDGFLFFDDIHKFLIDASVEENADVYLVVKKSANDELNEYLFEQNYKKFLNAQYEMPYSVHEAQTIKYNTALDYLKSVYPTVSYDETVSDLARDGSVEIVKPFPDRDSELRYVITQISDYIRENGEDNPLEIAKLLAETAIVIAVNKEEYEDRITLILHDIGVFLFDEISPQTLIFDKIVDSSSFGKIYYNRRDFLGEKVLFDDGVPLTYDQKYIFFSKAFTGIDINRSERPVATYPIGQFVFQIYDILIKGININAFKALLYSNWQYHTTDNETHWDQYISEFQLIESCFEDLTSLDDWIATLEDLIHIKTCVQSKPLFKYHPAYVVKDISLNFFLALLQYMHELITEIGSVSGNMAEHIHVLRSKVMKLEHVLELEDDKLSFEQQILKKLNAAVDSVGTSSIMANLDAKYFAENLKYMLSNYVEEEPEKASYLHLDVIKLVNIKKYARVYFVMMESGKYPRRYHEQFPYTKEILEILADSEYGINRVPLDYYTLDWHLKIEKYHFINVLDFTGEKLTITLSEREYGKKNIASVYVDDVEHILGLSAYRKEYALYLEDSVLDFDVSPKPKYAKISDESMSIKEMLTFYLCPKLYYHEQRFSNCYKSKFQLQFYFSSLLFSDTLNHFKAFNYDNKKVYNTSDNEGTEILLRFFEASFEYCSSLFPMFSEIEKQDIKNGVVEKIHTFIPGLLQHNVKGQHYTITEAENITYTNNEYTVSLAFDAKVYDMDFKKSRIISNNLFTEFLVLKTMDKAESPEHYDEMVAALHSDRARVDRINLIYKMIGKINRQFVSRFINDGWKRTDKLREDINNYDFLSVKPSPSNYCTYCRINEICMAESEAIN